jgi:AAA domain
MEMTEVSSFPLELLAQSPIAKLQYFKEITVPHQHLKSALDYLLLNLQEPADISIFFIVGPTGVGKTTLRLRAEKLLLEKYLPDLLINPGQIAIAGMEAVAAEQSKFSHRDYYIRALEAIGEVLASYKTSYGIHDPSDPIHPSRSSAALRRSLEKVLQYRQVKIFMVDEAHHLLMTAGAHQMLQQMSWIKSIANITNTTHALFGTYELLNCSRLSGQLSRRSEDIHLPRYRADIQEDVTEFRKVIQTFQQHLPLSKEPALNQWHEYLLDYSIGCVGILKTWLFRALRDALLEDAKTLTMKHLRQSEYSAARRQQLCEEADAGERRLQESKSSVAAFTVSPADKKQSVRKGRVGKRNPKRDPVGVSSNAN